MRSSQEILAARELPWHEIESRLIDLGFVPYRSERDERVVDAVDCCRCRRGLRYVGLRVGSRQWLAFGVCGGCGSWLAIEGSEGELACHP